MVVLFIKIITVDNIYNNIVSSGYFGELASFIVLKDLLCLLSYFVWVVNCYGFIITGKIKFYLNNTTN